MRSVSRLGVALTFAAAQVAAAAAQEPPPLPPQAVAALARGVKTIPNFNAAARTACGVEPWQVSFSAEGPNGVRVQRSPTMPARQARCVFALVGQSRFRLANTRFER